MQPPDYDLSKITTPQVRQAATKHSIIPIPIPSNHWSKYATG
jgi:hypothetical protein